MKVLYKGNIYTACEIPRYPAYYQIGSNEHKLHARAVDEILKYKHVCNIRKDKCTVIPNKKICGGELL